MLVEFPFEATTPWLKPPIHSSPPIFYFYFLWSLLLQFQIVNTQKAQCNEQKPPKLKIYREIIESRKGIRTYKFQGKFQNV